MGAELLWIEGQTYEVIDFFVILKTCPKTVE